MNVPNNCFDGNNELFLTKMQEVKVLRGIHSKQAMECIYQEIETTTTEEHLVFFVFLVQ